MSVSDDRSPACENRQDFNIVRLLDRNSAREGYNQHMRSPLFSLLASGASALTSQAQTNGQTSGTLTRTISVGDETFSYQLYVPARLEGQKNLPVILFLHGIGQRGEGGFLPDTGAAGTVARGYLEKVPAIILLPQCRKGLYWTAPEMEQMVKAELEQTVAEFEADTKRLYLAGVSMGGYGAWHLATQYPGKFAAIVSICGGSPLHDGDRYNPIARSVVETPAWIFHGGKDAVVPVTESRRMVEAIKAAGGKLVRYSEYEGVGHNVWLNAAAERELMPWLLAQHLD
jgi:predicted peptidase